MTDYARKINAFAMTPDERELFAGNVSGELLRIDVDAFRTTNEVRASCGGIEAVDVHPTLPYVAVLSGDKTMGIFRYGEKELTRIHNISLRDIIAENVEYQYSSPTMPLSQALAFHPTSRRILTRNMSGATLELEFDDERAETTWCHGYFAKHGGADDIAYVRYLLGSEFVFCSSRAGLVVVDPRNREEPVLRWQYDTQNIHCAEHVIDDEYLLASDSRRIFRFDMSGKKAPKIGPFVARDHIERISYNPVSKRAFCSSFDRDVYEFDRETLEPRGIVVHTPFKLRWLHSMVRSPEKMIIQCRNGALYKVDLDTKNIDGIIKETPNALWSGVATDRKHVYVAGEGPDVLELTVDDTKEANVSAKWLTLPGDPGRFTKRMIVHPLTGARLMARSDGDVVITEGESSRILTNLGAAIRDLAAPSDAAEFLAICENGKAHRVDLQTGAVLATHVSENDEPFWAMAYNPERRLLAVAERVGDLLLLDPVTMKVKFRMQGSLGYTKRMKWVDKNRLLINIGSSLYRLDVTNAKFELVIGHQTNTIEDFGWSEDRRFFALVHYHGIVALFDYATLAPLDSTVIDMDFPHGLTWMHPERSKDAYPYELIVFGRSGVARRYQIHNERLVNCGPLNELSTPIHDKGLRVVGYSEPWASAAE